MKIVKVRNVAIGEGQTKIIVPIVADTAEGIVEKGRSLRAARLDAIEWRVDFFGDVFDTEKVLATAKRLREALGETPLLFTFRTKNEGGERAIAPAAYVALNIAVAESGFVDLVDVEMFSDPDTVRAAVEGVHRAGVPVVGSNHDFSGTPEKDEIVRRLCAMQERGADICKTAYMPKSAADVLTLLTATNEMAAKYADRPLITMSMGGVGLISRLCGEVFGSAMTFGAVGQVSAPGQIPVEELDTVLRILHEHAF